MYQRSARIYDLLYAGSGIKDFDVDAAQIHEIVQRLNPAARTLLDIACGTGAHLARLREHYTVAGVDASPEMIAVARERLPSVPLRVADMQHLNLGQTFDAVTCLFSSIGYVTDATELVETVRGFAAHLAPRGLLILDGWIRPEAWIDEHRSAPDIADDGEITVVRLARSHRDGRMTTIDMHHLVRAGHDVEYFVERHELALVPTGEYVAAAQAAGLHVDVVPDYMPGRDRLIGVRPA